MDLYQIEETIKELENAPTTFQNCINLAALYQVQEHLESSKFETNSYANNNVSEELKDILPAYTHYIAAKRRYQLNEIDIDPVNDAMQSLCQEIREFISVLYATTECRDCRMQIEDLLHYLYSTFSHKSTL